jgi:hypothetical protein
MCARGHGCETKEGHSCETKEVNVQSFSLAATDAGQLMTQKSRSQPAARTAVDGIRIQAYFQLPLNS